MSFAWLWIFRAEQPTVRRPTPPASTTERGTRPPPEGRKNGEGVDRAKNPSYTILPSSRPNTRANLTFFQLCSYMNWDALFPCGLRVHAQTGRGTEVTRNMLPQ